MSRPGLDLAARLRAALEARRDAARLAETEKKAQLARLLAARQTLLADLDAFGRAVGFLDVTAGADVVVFRHEGRVLRFEAQAPTDGVRVRCEGFETDTRLLFNETMGKWVLAVARPGASDDQRLLFDAGLAWLMERGLGLRDDSEAPAAGAPNPRSDRSL